MDDVVVYGTIEIQWFKMKRVDDSLKLAEVSLAKKGGCSVFV